MPLEHEDQHRLLAAQGYCELGMFLGANTELQKIPPEYHHLPEVLGVRVEIYRNLEEWDLMQAVAKQLA